jgi:segregation and condensation protein B
MGVRGKIEAVIYAAEEPVTLQQLAALFGQEALAEREAAAVSNQAELHAQQAVDSLAEQTELPIEQLIELVAELPSVVLPSGSDPDAVDAQGDNSDDSTGDTEQQPGLEQELADRRHARQRDRAARDAVRDVVEEIMSAYQSAEGGMEIREVAGGYRVATKPEYHDAVRAFVKSLKPVMKLSLQALETLAVIAYKQPVTAPEVSEIRGVDSGGVLGSLMSRKLITTAGRKQVIGRPILYKTTKEFLLRFGLKDIAELPSMEEFEKMAGELQQITGEAEDMPDTEPIARQPLEIVPAMATNATPEHGAPELLSSALEDDAPVEWPSLAPAPIVVSIEELPAHGISVTLSGTARPDPVAPLSAAPTPTNDKNVDEQ